MKKRTIITLLLPLLLISCATKQWPSSESNESNIIESEEYPDVEFTPMEGTVDLFAINDFHGSVIQNGYEMGILKVGSYLKQRQQEENTVVINSGDYWQGSLQSNMNYGEFLTKIANDIEFDAMTIGNHEFDWGVNYINRNSEFESDTGYKTPFLGANIYNYSISTGEVDDYANLGKKYVIKTLENGLRVGIIGLIGDSQISSITSSYVDHLTFIDPFNVVKELSNELRNEKGCHLVVLSAHEGAEDIAYATDGSGKKIADYVDVIFGGHSHQREAALINGRVPALQGSSNGKAISKVSLKVNLDRSVEIKSYTNLLNADFETPVDNEIQAIYDTYIAEADTRAKETLANFSGVMSKSNVPYLMTASIASYAAQNNINIDYAVVNQARNSLGNDTTITYEDLYRAFPFDNEVYVVEVLGSELQTNLNRNYFYRLDPSKIDTTKTYTCAIIDYVALHRNDDREYDNFTHFNIKGSLKKEGLQIYNYREICADWLRNLEVEAIDISYFQGSNLRHNKSSLSQDVTLPNNPYVG